MSGDERDGDRENEYAGWRPPGETNADVDDDAGTNAGEWGPPPTMREPLFRDRLRRRLGVTHRQWYVIETFLLVLPYPFFVLVYVTFDVDETLFLLFTLAYSLFATYVGFLS